MSAKKKKEEVKRHPLDVAKDQFRGNIVEVEDCIANQDGYYGAPGDMPRIIKAGEKFVYHGELDPVTGELPFWIDAPEDFKPAPKAAAAKAIEKKIESDKELV